MKKPYIAFVFIVLALTLFLVACDSATPAATEDAIPLEMAFLLRNQEEAGILRQSNLADVTESLQNEDTTAAQIASGTFGADALDFQELVILFPAEQINGQSGYFMLGLSVRDEDPSTETTLTARRASLIPAEDGFVAQVELVTGGSVGQRWAYTRLPETRQVFQAQSDDPDNVLETEIFHQAPLIGDWPPPSESSSDGVWKAVDFALPLALIDQTVHIDQCEILLEALDKELTAQTGVFLQWSTPLVTDEAIDAVASNIENDSLPEGQVYHLQLDAGDLVIDRNQPIQTQVEHPITLIGDDGQIRAASVACSISG